MRSLAVSLLLSSTSAVSFKHQLEDKSFVQVPRNSLEAIIEQEAAQNDSVYPPSQQVQKPESDKKADPLPKPAAKKPEDKSKESQSVAAGKSNEGEGEKQKTAHDDVKNNPDNNDPQYQDEKKKTSSKIQEDEKKKYIDHNNEKTDLWNIPVVDFNKEYDHIGYTR